MNTSKCLTVFQLCKALNNCNPEDKIQFFTEKGEELKIVFVEKSLQRDVVYLLSEVPVINTTDGMSGTSITTTTADIPYLGDTIRWEDEGNE